MLALLSGFSGNHKLGSLSQRVGSGAEYIKVIYRLCNKLACLCLSARRAIDGKIFSALFKRRINRDVFFMATGESLAHLMCLVHRGDLSMTFDNDGVCYFESA